MRKSPVERIEKKLEQLEKALHFHGHWITPDQEVPVIRPRMNWKKEAIRLAELMNRIYRIRSLPAIERFYGPVDEDEPFEFVYDSSDDKERLEQVEKAFHELIKQLDLLPGFDPSEYEDEELEGFDT